MTSIMEVMVTTLHPNHLTTCKKLIAFQLTRKIFSTQPTNNIYYCRRTCFEFTVSLDILLGWIRLECVFVVEINLQIYFNQEWFLPLRKFHELKKKNAKYFVWFSAWKWNKELALKHCANLHMYIAPKNETKNTLFPQLVKMGKPLLPSFAPKYWDQDSVSISQKNAFHCLELVFGTSNKKYKWLFLFKLQFLGLYK